MRVFHFPTKASIFIELDLNKTHLYIKLLAKRMK
jgi:hypothetical protein